MRVVAGACGVADVAFFAAPLPSGGAGAVVSQLTVCAFDVVATTGARGECVLVLPVPRPAVLSAAGGGGPGLAAFMAAVARCFPTTERAPQRRRVAETAASEDGVGDEKEDEDEDKDEAQSSSSSSSSSLSLAAAVAPAPAPARLAPHTALLDGATLCATCPGAATTALTLQYPPTRFAFVRVSFPAPPAGAVPMRVAVGVVHATPGPGELFLPTGAVMAAEDGARSAGADSAGAAVLAVAAFAPSVYSVGVVREVGEDEASAAAAAAAAAAAGAGVDAGAGSDAGAPAASGGGKTPSDAMDEIRRRHAVGSFRRLVPPGLVWADCVASAAHGAPAELRAAAGAGAGAAALLAVVRLRRAMPGEDLRLRLALAPALDAR
jgi:hypothetical protein